MFLRQMNLTCDTDVTDPVCFMTDESDEEMKQALALSAREDRESTGT